MCIRDSSRAADSVSVSSTVCRSNVERLMTLSTSAVAVCCCSDCRSGVMANTNIRGRYLDDPYFWPLYEALQNLDAPLFLHPANAYGADKLRDFHLSFLLGLPAESTLSVARLTFSGTLDRFPKLRLFVPH